MSRSSKGQHAVMAVETAPGWQPQSWHSLPTIVLSVRWLHRRVHLHRAVRLVRLFNAPRLQSFAGEWALLVTDARSSRKFAGREECRKNLHRRVAKGGAA